MSTFQKLGMVTLGIAAMTTLILPDRQTVPVLGALGRLGTGTLSTAMGTSRGAVR